MNRSHHTEYQCDNHEPSSRRRLTSGSNKASFAERKAHQLDDRPSQNASTGTYYRLRGYHGIAQCRRKEALQKVYYYPSKVVPTKKGIGMHTLFTALAHITLLYIVLTSLGLLALPVILAIPKMRIARAKRRYDNDLRKWWNNVVLGRQWNDFMREATRNGNRLVLVLRPYQLAERGAKSFTESYRASASNTDSNETPTLVPYMTVLEEQDTWFSNFWPAAGTWYSVPSGSWRTGYGPHNDIDNVLYVYGFSNRIIDQCRIAYNDIYLSHRPQPQPWQYGLTAAA